MPDTTTRVQFRKYNNGTIVACLLDSSQRRNGYVTLDVFESSERQHAPAMVSYLLAQTTVATPQEYDSLKRYLEAAPYNYRFKVATRFLPCIC